MTLTRPQRILSVSPPGALLKRVDTQPRLRRFEQGEGRADGHLALVRQCPCVRCGLDPCGTAAHLRMNSGAFNKRQAMARKPSGEWVTPLCSACHLNDPDAQHCVGEQIFWARLDVNPFLLCQQLFAATGDLVRMRAIVFTTIAERGTWNGKSASPSA